MELVREKKNVNFLATKKQNFGLDLVQQIKFLPHIPYFNNPEKEACEKHHGKGRKFWWPAFSSFPTMFSTHPRKNFSCIITFILSSVNAFILDQSKNLSFGKELMSLK